MAVETELKVMIEAKSGTVKAFSEMIDLPYTTVRSILERGVLNSKVDNIIKICDGLGIKAEDLLGLENNTSLISIYNQLNHTRKEKVLSFAELQLKEQSKKKTVLTYGQTAAGAPITYGDDIVEEKEVSNIPKGADCALVVKGDSMEPEFHHGSVVFYKSQPALDNGEIGVFEIDGEAVTMKRIEYDYDNKKILLQSLNKKYEDLIFKNDQIRILGKVVK